MLADLLEVLDNLVQVLVKLAEVLVNQVQGLALRVHRLDQQLRSELRYHVDRLPAITAALPVLSFSWISVLRSFARAAAREFAIHSTR